MKLGTAWLFDSSGLTPHGFCLLWEPGQIWLHALSDIGIALSYFAIPVVLTVIVRRRQDLFYRPVAILFSAFILFCGTGHFLDLLTIWVPVYGIEGFVKAVTAIISIATTIYMVCLVPEAVALPSPQQMRDLSAALNRAHEAELHLGLVVAETAQVRDALAGELERRKLSEAALRETDEKLKLLLQSDLSEALYLLDPNGTIETWNAGAEKLKGYTADEAIGQSFAMLFTQEQRDAGEPALVLDRARAKVHHTTDGFRVRKDRTQFVARVAIDAILREDNTLRGFVVMTLDLTKQHIHDAQRRIIIEAAPNGLMMVDEFGSITLSNSVSETIFGYGRGELLGLQVNALIPDHALVGAPSASTDIPTDGIFVRQTRGLKRDGSAVVIELKVSSVRLPVGDIFVLAVEDITERQRLETEAREAERIERQAIEQANEELDRLARHLEKARVRAEHANQAKSRFLAGMSHELRTPLTAIIGYANLLSMDGELSPIQRTRLNSIVVAGRHLLELITGVLDLSEIESERVTLHATEVDVRTIGETCLDLVRPPADAKNLALSLTVRPGTVPILVVDPKRLRQILLNLLGNAIKFTQQGYVAVQLRNSADGSALRIEVRDTGPGIPAERRPRLFQMFDRIDAPDIVEGAGLGLAISSKLTKVLGGTLSYEDNEGGGSVFWMELPFRTAIAPLPRVAGASSGNSTNRVLHVLVVDNAQEQRDILEVYLSAAGQQVTSVTNGLAAVEATAVNDYDIVLMDLNLLDISGLEATRRIRALRGVRGRVPIIGLTARANAYQGEQCRAAGMDAHLGRPFDSRTLYAMIDLTLDGRRRNSYGDENVQEVQHQVSDYPLQTDDTVGQSSFEVGVFERTRERLKPHYFALYFRNLELMCDVMMSDLRGLSNTALSHEDLVDSVRSLSRIAGMFGFLKLSGYGRQLERDLLRRAGDLPTLSDTFLQELEIVQKEVKRRIFT